MFASIVRFELRYQLHQPAFYACFVAFALVGYLVAIAAGMARGAVRVNAPSSIAHAFVWFSLFGAFVPLWFCSDAALRDRDAGMSELVRTSPTPAWLGLLGRLSGAFAAVCLVFFASMVGFEVGCRMWWIDPTRVASFPPLAYANTLAVLVFPNLIVLGAIFLLIATATRSRFATYIALMGIFVITVAGVPMAWTHPTLASLFDATGLVALLKTIAHWSNVERNTLLVPLQGLLLWNRLFWWSIGLCCLALAALLLTRRDSPGSVGAGSAAAAPADLIGPGHAASAAVVSIADPDPAAAIARRPIAPYTGAGLADQVLARLWFEVRALLRSWTFLTLVMVVGVPGIVALWAFRAFVDMPSLPVTASVAPAVAAVCSFPLLLIAVLFGGEMVWRERQAKVAELLDATPTPSAVFAITKLGALALLMAALLGLATAAGVGYQLVSGAPRIDLQFYAVESLVVVLLPTMMVAVLAMLVHVVVNNRFAGHLVTIGLIAGFTIIEHLGLESRLIRFADLPEVLLSDMDGVGHFLTAPLWFLAYWGCISVLLFVATVVLWVRGPAFPLLARVRPARYALTRSTLVVALLAIFGTGLTGGYIYWNTHILNPHMTEADRERWSVDYEKRFGPHLGAMQPRVTKIDIAIDLYPETRAYSARGQYVLANLSDQPIETVFVQFHDKVGVDSVELAGAARVETESWRNVYVFRSPVPLAPGETRTLSFAVSLARKGFTNDVDRSSIRYNGTFLNGAEFSARIGLDPRHFLKDEHRRRAQGLAPADKASRLGGSPYRRNYISGDADFLRFAVTISTSLDQIAVAPGTLQREWVDGGRKYFRYEMDRPILNHWSVVSARYAVTRDRWNGVELAVYHHPPHAQHVQRMLEAMKVALAYCTSEFGPYQHRQLHIVQVPPPRDEVLGQAFPSMIAIFDMAFIADPGFLEPFDPVSGVTAHEVAHQWWAYQVISADVPGAIFLSETLAEYSALMIMEITYGKDRIRAFLKRNLDLYLRGRGGDAKERPLTLVGRHQEHIAYKKGGIAMYALKEAIGEVAVNRALARLVREHASKSDPYPTPDDLIRLLRAEAGPAHRQLITDLFERIVLWDYSVVGAKAAATEDGKWLVELKVRARKLEADESGVEKEVPLDQYVDVGLFATDPRTPSFTSRDVLVLDRRRLKSGTHTIKLVTAQRPAFAGINPYLTLVQRHEVGTVVSVPP